MKLGTYCKVKLKRSVRGKGLTLWKTREMAKSQPNRHMIEIEEKQRLFEPQRKGLRNAVVPLRCSVHPGLSCEVTCDGAT